MQQVPVTKRHVWLSKSFLETLTGQSWWRGIAIRSRAPNWRGNGGNPGLPFPYFVPNSRCILGYRLRRDRPELEADSSGQPKPKERCRSPHGGGNMLHLVSCAPKDDLANSWLRIVTKGEFKTLALGVGLSVAGLKTG
jgi:hypothetical protein